MATISPTTSTSPSSGLAASRPKSVSAIITMAGVLSFVALVVALHFLRSDLNPLSQPTSAYAVGSYSFIMTATFFSMSLASFALIFGLYQHKSRSALSKIGLIFLAAWATGVLIAMIFPMDADGAPSTLSGTIHETDGPPTFLCLTTGMILVSLVFRRDGEWRAISRISLALSLIMLLSFAATFISFITDSGTVGLAQRAALATAVSWMLLVSMRIRSLPSRAVPTY